VRPVCVVGLGLIGGSLLRAAGATGRTVWGVTASGADAVAAGKDGYTVVARLEDALERARRQDAVVVLAVPLPAVEEILRKVPPECLLTDVVSVKAPVLEAVQRILPGARYAGGHPMAGTAESGWAAGSRTLFDGAAWVVTTDTDLATWRAVAELAVDCGARVVPVTAKEHDAAVAMVSHLPHVLAAVLASTGAHGGPLALSLAAGSFGDGTRVAGSRPELVLAMCEGNRAALLEAVDEALGKLGAARGALASTGSLRATIQAGHVARRELVEHREGPWTPREVDLTRPDALDVLGEIGSLGGHVTGFDGEVARAEVPGLG
jgi:prephenate dehydrogenase